MLRTEKEALSFWPSVITNKSHTSIICGIPSLCLDDFKNMDIIETSVNSLAYTIVSKLIELDHPFLWNIIYQS